MTGAGRGGNRKIHKVRILLSLFFNFGFADFRPAILFILGALCSGSGRISAKANRGQQPKKLE